MKLLLPFLMLFTSMQAYANYPIATQNALLNYFRDNICGEENGLICEQPGETYLIVKSSAPDSQSQIITRYELGEHWAAIKEIQAASAVKFPHDGMLRRIDAERRYLSKMNIACQATGAACLALSGLIVTINPIAGVGLAFVCSGVTVACVESISYRNKKIDDLAAKIVALCAEGDEDCYLQVIRHEYPDMEIKGSPSQSGDPIADPKGGSGTGAPGSGVTPGSPTTPDPKLHGSETGGKETSPDGKGMVPVKFPDPAAGPKGVDCKKNPKATGCKSPKPPKQEA